MKLKLALLALCGLLVVAAAPANAVWYTMDFTNATLDLGMSSQIDITNQYAYHGFVCDKAYRYIDKRDPWPEIFIDPDLYGFGISNGFIQDNEATAAMGTVYFNQVTDSLKFDWWTIGTNRLTLDTYASDGTLLGTYSNTGSGTQTMYGAISYFTYHDDGGYVQVANMSYDSTIPEPGTLALLGIGLLGAGLYRRRKK
jgi:hypothetical protein